MNGITTLRPPRQLSDKVGGTHLERLAVVYVRQSTLQQLERHQESTRLQYGLVERAWALGWARERIEVIDEDLGKSAATAEGRSGFQRLLSEVALDHVGIVLGIEMSRLARSCRDWYQLLEVCGLFGTLIGDLDGVYDPADYNDRLLLGLKGTMSEAELHVLKQRLLAGRRAKAARGELSVLLPIGYARLPSGEAVKDPDEQAQAVVALVFEQFARCGTVNGVLQYLVRHHVELPCRSHSRRTRGDLQWHAPNRVTLSNLLHNPVYAGAYVYGRRPTEARRQKPGRPRTGRRVAAAGDWPVLLKDRLPAYISWPQFEANVRRITDNAARGKGPIRHGPSLLSGLVVCGRCGLRMLTRYGNNGQELRYACAIMAVDYGRAPCQSLLGRILDDWVGQQVLAALQPAALEVSLRAIENVQTERAQLHRHWQLRLERAGYEAQRAQHQFNAVEPENRLVARTLERQWETALAAQAQLQGEYARFQAEQPAVLDEAEREAIRRLAADIPALWHAPTTTAADRQAIVRQLVERVVVRVHGQSERFDVQLHWIGGHATEATLVRPVARLDQLSYYPQLLARAAALHAQGERLTAIAERLNAEGWHPAKRRETFNASMVHVLLALQGLCSRGRRYSDAVEQRATDEWTLSQLAHRLTIPEPTLYSWLRRGELRGRRVAAAAHPVWLIQADEAELARLRALRTGPRTWH
jgi:DNA invertase Pin-like site-specific DNA recombinase